MILPLKVSSYIIAFKIMEKRKSIDLLKSRGIILISFFALLNSWGLAQGVWTGMGPGGGGWITAITVVDDAQHTVYVGCDVGGIYKSTDNGNSWEIKDRGISTYFVQDIAYDYQHPEVVYAATRGGVFKSVDGGEHWVVKRLGFPPNADFNFSAPVNTIVVDNVHPNVLYAGIGVSKGGYDFNPYHWDSSDVKGTVYKSVDYGESWVPLHGTGMDVTALVYSLAIDPHDSSVLYAATDKGVYKSEDSGASWTPKNVGLPHQKIMKIAINPSNTNILYVTIWATPGSTQWEGGVYKSTDGGDSWVAQNEGLPQVVGDVSGFTCNYPNIVIDNAHPETIYVGNIPWTPDPGVYKSTDGGAHWTWVSRPESPNKNMDVGWIVEHEVSVMSMAIDPNDSNRLYFGTSTHIFTTDDGGDFWRQAYTHDEGNGYWRGNGFETTVVQSIAVDPSDNDNIYVGYWDIGFFKSTDGGETFKKTATGMTYASNTFDIIVDSDNPAIIYAACGWWEENKGEVYKSTDYGETWTVLNNGIPDAQIWSIALDENSPESSRTLYAASYDHGAYKTTDGGQNWFPINNGLGVDNNLLIKKIAIDPNHSNVLYAGFSSKVIEEGDNYTTIQGGLFKSVNGGDSWTRVDIDLPQISVSDIAITGGDTPIVYTAVSSEYDHTEGEDYFGGVYKSIDEGATWARMAEGFGDLENLNVSAIAISAGDENVLFAATIDAPFHDEASGRGIFKSTDAGSTWQPINDGLGVLYFNTITSDPISQSVLYAGSGGNGVLKYQDNNIFSTTEIEKNETPAISAYNQPNPISTSTQIHYSLAFSGYVDLNIYDVRGQLVRTILYGKYHSEGEYDAIWDGKDALGKEVISGLYFYRITVGGKQVTGKMVVQREN